MFVGSRGQCKCLVHRGSGTPGTRDPSECLFWVTQILMLYSLTNFVKFYYLSKLGFSLCSDDSFLLFNVHITLSEDYET